MADTPFTVCQQAVPTNSPSNEAQALSPELSEATTTHSEAQMLRTFHCFPDLPPELRLMIWERCLPHTIHLYREQDPETDPPDIFLGHGKHSKEHQLGNKTAQLPVISRVCVEARSVALHYGSVRKTMVYRDFGEPHETSEVWVDGQRDTVLINTAFWIHEGLFSELYMDIDTVSDVHVVGLIRKNRVLIAILDETIGKSGCESWTSCFIYKDLIQGYEECDFGLVEIQFDITDQEALHTDLFGLFGTESIALIPVDSQCQMAKLFAAQAKFDHKIRWPGLSRLWDTDPSGMPGAKGFPMPESLNEYTEKWVNWGAERTKDNQNLIARALVCDEAGHDIEEENPEKILKEHWDDEPLQRIAEIKAKMTKFRPVIVVHRCSLPVLVE